MTTTTRGRTITESDIASFAALTGDWHPQHADAEWAAKSRFGERVAHGMLVLSYAVGLAPFDPDRIVALRGVDDVTFKRPVLIGDTIRVSSKVEAVTPLDGDHELLTLAWRVLNQRDEVVVRARVQALGRTEAALCAEAAPIGNGNGHDGASELHALYGERVCL